LFSSENYKWIASSEECIHPRDDETGRTIFHFNHVHAGINKEKEGKKVGG